MHETFLKCDLSKKNVKYFGSHEIVLIAMLLEIDRTEFYREPVVNIWIISINHVQIYFLIELFTIILIQIYNMILEYFYSWQGENKCILMHKKSGVIFILSWELFTFLYRSLVQITPDIGNWNDLMLHKCDWNALNAVYHILLFIQLI